jgi:hypothetical protein
VIRLLVALFILFVPSIGRAAETGPAAQCAHAGDDDTVRPYDPALREGVLAAYAHLFPRARVLSEQQLQAGAHIRCMNGRLLACFTGANLPCGKMNASRDNQSATAFCATQPDAQVVPAFATGHDSAYLYRCEEGRAEVSGETFLLDGRGFAAELWAPIVSATRP